MIAQDGIVYVFGHPVWEGWIVLTVALMLTASAFLYGYYRGRKWQDDWLER